MKLPRISSNGTLLRNHLDVNRHRVRRLHVYPTIKTIIRSGNRIGGIITDGGWRVNGKKYYVPGAGPNPATGKAVFAWSFDGTNNGPGVLTVYDIAGRKVDAVYFDCAGSSGTVEWDAVSADAPSGVYIARVEAGETAAAVKFVVVR